jgi:RNA polymerase sigma-70 factor (ECF subfamily)
VPYWVWLRRLALQRLTWWRRFHIGSLKRSVTREAAAVAAPASSQPRCVDGLVDSSISPSGRAAGNEEQLRARLALESLDASDREILHLRYLEDLSFAEIASRLGLGLSAVKMRHVRALERFRTVLNPSDPASQP